MPPHFKISALQRFSFLACLLSSFILHPSSFSQSSGQSVIDKKNSGTGFTREAFTLGNSQIIGRTSSGTLSGLTLGTGFTLTGTTLTAAGGSTVEPSFESAITITDINDPANNGSELNGIIIRSNRENIAQHQQLIIFGNGDKTGRIVAPALIGDYVWYLPQSTGSIMLDSDNTGGIAAARLTSGTVPTARLGSGTASASTYLRGDGTWATVTGGVTSITGTANQITVTGTTTPVLSLPATITGLTSVTSTTFVGALTGTASGNLVSGGALGTPSSGTLTNCTNIPAANLTGTIDTARLPGTITGLTSLTSTTLSASATVVTGNGIYMTTNSPIRWNGVQFLTSNATHILDQQNATNAQTYRVANTYTSLTNLEVGVMDWRTTTNTLRIGSSKGSGGGSNRAVHFIMGDAVEMRFDTDGNVILPLLPTTAPATSGALWRDAANGNVLKVVP